MTAAASRCLSHGWLFALAAAIQVALLAWMVVDRALILARGSELTLNAQPVDPRDLLRGDYVSLRYDIGSVDVVRLKIPVEDMQTGRLARGHRVWVTLRRLDGGGLQPVAVNEAPVAVGDGNILIAGRSQGCGWRQGTNSVCPELRVDYGIESYFVPEGEGRNIEMAARAGRVQVVAAVTPDGRAAIKRLLLDGQPVYDEPLF